MKDLLGELSAVHRGVAREGGGADEVVRVTMRRHYPTGVEDLWEALTDPERIARWFTPVSGELRVSGQFQLEGNAGGDILACEPPRLLRTTFADPSSVVTVTLTARGAEETELVLEHTVPVAMAGSVAGALFVGPGWDSALLGLALYVDDHGVGVDVPAAVTTEVQEQERTAVDLWTAVVSASGASAEETEGARQAALAQFAPEAAQ